RVTRRIRRDRSEPLVGLDLAGFDRGLALLLLELVDVVLDGLERVEGRGRELELGVVVDHDLALVIRVRLTEIAHRATPITRPRTGGGRRPAPRPPAGPPAPRRPGRAARPPARRSRGTWDRTPWRPPRVNPSA